MVKGHSFYQILNINIQTWDSKRTRTMQHNEHTNGNPQGRLIKR